MSSTTISADVLIIGAGYAGRYAAARVRTREPDLRIVVVEPNDFELHRTRSHQYAAGEALDERRLATCLPPDAQHVRGVATRVDPVENRCIVRTVSRDTNESATVAIDFRSVIVATGSRARVLENDDSIPCLGVDDRRLRERLSSAGRIAVVGGGLSGVEMASELAEQTDSRIFFVAPGVLPNGSEQAREHARAFLDEHEVRCVHDRASRVEQGRLVLDDDEPIAVDAVISAIGFGPIRPEFTAGYGGPGDVTDGLNLAAHPHVFFAGDAGGRLAPNRAYAPSCALSMPMGLHAAENVVRLLGGEAPEPFDFGVIVRFISLGRHDGIVDFRTRDGRPTGRALTGRIAAFAKERILRMTEWALTVELKTGLPIYDWPKGLRAKTDTATLAPGGQP